MRFRVSSGSGSTLWVTRRGQRKGVSTYTLRGVCCQYTWARPHLLLFIDTTLVSSLDPASRKVRNLAQLSDSIVSPDGRWFAGDGASLSPYAYVVSTDGRKCLVIPGRTFGVRGFTPDSKAVIILRTDKYPKRRLIQYSIASLRTACPTGYDGVLLQHEG